MPDEDTAPSAPEDGPRSPEDGPSAPEDGPRSPEGSADAESERASTPPAARASAAARALGARVWSALAALAARLRPPVVRYGPLVVLWLAGAGLILSEFLTYREIVAVTVVPDGGITKGGEHHGYALALLGLASLPMAFGAVIGRSRPASAAVAVLGALALAIIAAFDVSSLDDTGLIGRTYDLAEASPGPGFWLSVVCAAVLLLGGLLLLRARVSSAREESEARRSRRRARRAAETEAPPPSDPDADAGDAGSRSTPRDDDPSGSHAAGARRPTRPR